MGCSKARTKHCKAAAAASVTARRKLFARTTFAALGPLREDEIRLILEEHVGLSENDLWRMRAVSVGVSRVVSCDTVWLRRSRSTVATGMGHASCFQVGAHIAEVHCCL